MISAGSELIVLCDANVLYKNVLRDLIVRLGVKGTLAPRWTDRVHDEWITNLLEHRPDLSHARLQRTREVMNRAVRDSLHATTLTGNHHLPDPDDQHVLDAALSAGASVLLTFNLADFPSSALPASLQAIHPDAFLVACLEQQPGGVLAALHELRADLKKPPFSPDELLAALVRAELPLFAGQLKRFRDSL
ncbi:hypothetical protein GCM10022631_40830 [Deinococcus rubellus]|uniref:PIN domain-containing protein n=1 Tax=Deinococcus rubellus TaxID=1889240 RepID=A0ABY5YFM5_9DEIO|nr:PIN domain-containing protein [Deinococcus rubellus]UWX63872.1 PIN domain-containing protein [Deinococcus rubellus]